MSLTEGLHITEIVILVITLGFIIWTLREVLKHSEYLRKQVFGEVFDQAQISDLRFYLPARRDYIVQGFEQEQQEDEESDCKNIQIPIGQKRELHIKWKIAKSQTLRSFTVGFRIPEGQSALFEDNPELIERTSAFVKKPISVLPREEYIDWHEVYHCEYGHARRLSKDEDFVVSLIVRGRKEGKYFLDVHIQVSEAPNPFEGELEVKVIS